MVLQQQPVILCLYLVRGMHKRNTFFQMVTTFDLQVKCLHQKYN